MIRPTTALLVALTAAACTDRGTGATTTPAAATSRPEGRDGIAWHTWSKAAFEQARREDKLVLVDVGIEGCTACRWMAEDTYRHRRVVELVRAHFVAIAVDAEARPDIGERYSAYAWPATVFMTPDGTEILALRGNKRPRNFVPILEELVARKAAGTLEAMDPSPEAGDDPVVDASWDERRADVVAQLDRAFDPEDPAWGRTQKMALLPPLEHAYLRAHVFGERIFADRALAVTRRMEALLDTVWGGIFVAGIERWENFVPEKRISSNAAALFAFALAYDRTRDDRFRDDARTVDRFLRGFMRSPRGTFYTSQEDDAPSLPKGMDARAYYRLGDQARRAYGIPPIDHAEYTDKNAEAIRAYLALFAATGERAALDVARTAADRLLADRQTDEGWMLQLVETPEMAADDRMRPDASFEAPYLRPQALFGLALLELHVATGDGTYLAAARRIAEGLERRLWDDGGGGFFAGPEDPAGVLPRRKPVEDNAVAARFLLLAGGYLRNDHWTNLAHGALRAVAVPERVRPEGRMIGNLAIALDLARSGLLDFTVDGAPSDPRSVALWRAAARIYEPRKVLAFDTEDHYPDRGRPALYVCNDQACSPPIYEPSEVAPAAARFAALDATRGQTTPHR
ncbi:MAG: thioredoxin domain-containing protein [Deltaproteobacteria bacterium]|nr:MAG: thioredoxin domain-containing protein [Deltaproteobacteria bacterium]